MRIHCCKYTSQNQEKLYIFVGTFSRIHKVYTVIRSKGPVIVLTRTVHTRKRFFMKEALQAMSGSYLLQAFHNQLIMVQGNICLLINHGKLMLRRGYLIVLRFHRYAETPKLLIEVAHKLCYSLSNNTVVVVIQLLPFCRHCPKKSSSGVN